MEAIVFSETSSHLYTLFYTLLFVQAVIAAGCYVLTVLPGAPRQSNCSYKLGQNCVGNNVQRSRETALAPLRERVWVLQFWGRKDGSVPAIALLGAACLQVLAIFRTLLFLELQIGSEGQQNRFPDKARKEMITSSFYRWLLKYMHTHLKAPLPRKAVEKGTVVG